MLGATTLWPVIGAARTVSPVFTLEDVDLVSQWLRECLELHPECSIGEPRLPTRVLFVGSGNQDPYLYESQREIAQYTALSHCWGDPRHPPLRTTVACLSARKKSIPLHELPPTFVDSVLLTRKLGIKYL